MPALIGIIGGSAIGLLLMLGTINMTLERIADALEKIDKGK